MCSVFLARSGREQHGLASIYLQLTSEFSAGFLDLLLRFFQKKFESLFKDKLEVIRMYQQQENQKFMSHFRKKFFIRRGRRNLALSLGGKWPELFHMRANGSAVCNRIIQIDCQAKNLNSAFYYILRCPMKAGDDEGCSGKVFVWQGSKVDVYFADVANEVGLGCLVEYFKFIILFILSPENK